jgi:hypothetical protein
VNVMVTFQCGWSVGDKKRSDQMTLTLVTTSRESAGCSSKDEGACARNEQMNDDLHEHS